MIDLIKKGLRMTSRLEMQLEPQECFKNENRNRPEIPFAPQALN